MYSMVMMMSVAGAGDMASFGGRGNGCGGGCSGAVVVSSGCSGSSCRGGHAFLGGRHSCNGSSCSGAVISSGCSGNSCNGGHGFLGGRRAKHSCCGSVPATNCCPAPAANCCGSTAVAAPCSYGTAVIMPAEAAKPMVGADGKPVEKK